MSNSNSEPSSGVVPVHPSAAEPLALRLWLYQAERFPIFKTALLLAVFSSASITVSAHLGGRSLPEAWVFLTVWFVTFTIFFQMRACDEWKDLEDDRNFRPERPIPSGLVSLDLILWLAVSGGIIAAFLMSLISLKLLMALGLVWIWLGLMTFEFFVPDWLKKRPVLYLVSHMAIMPLIDLFITASEWLPAASGPPTGLWLFLLLSFANGCVLEIGRKVWAPENERDGVETYSGLLGPQRAAWCWFATCVSAWLLLVCVGYFVDAPLIVGTVGLILLIYVAWLAKSFAHSPTPRAQKTIDTVAGLWVFTCYCLAGFAPFISRFFAA